jgi:hypothetical protein
MSRSSKWSPSSRFPHQNPVCFSPSSPCVTCLPPPSYFAKSTNHDTHHSAVFFRFLLLPPP